MKSVKEVVYARIGEWTKLKHSNIKPMSVIMSMPVDINYKAGEIYLHEEWGEIYDAQEGEVELTLSYIVE
jgi:hypothetical protein